MFRKFPPFHPILFAVFPLLSLYSANMNNLSFGNILPTLLIVILFSLITWSGFYKIFHDPRRSAIASSLVLFVFFSFAHSLSAVSVIAKLINSYEKIRLLVETRTGMLILLSIEVFLLIGIIVYLSRHKYKLNNLTKFFNFISVILISVVVFTIISNQFRHNQVLAGAKSNSDGSWKNEIQRIDLPNRNLPDIYYIILDGYGRLDVLENIYQYDNNKFISFLESKDFFVAKNSHANYSQTGLSLASSLNFNYLDELTRQVGTNSENLSPIKASIENNLTFQQLRDAGYKIISFSSGFNLTELSTTDQILAPSITPDSFQNILINNTPLSLLLLGKQYDWHRQRIQYTLQTLADIPLQSQPTFVFAHIIAPHPPFVFGKNGEPINPPRKYGIHDGSDFLAVASREEYLNGYRDQLSYLTNTTEAVMKEILEKSQTEPVIIVQSDHGPGYLLDHNALEGTFLPERMSILNAYLLPEIDAGLLYNQITPVNSFRLLFNAYLGTDYQLLEDKSYFSTIDQPFQFTDVTTTLNQ